MTELVIKVEREPRTGIICHTVDTDGKLEQRRYRDVHAGLSWPGAGCPGHYLIVAELSINEKVTKFEDVEPQRGKLVVLAERSINSPFLNELATALTDDCARFGASGIFAEIEEDDAANFRDERANLFRELLTAAGYRGSLSRAPYTTGASTGTARAEALQLALSIVSLWLKEDRLELPEGSTALEQLRAVTREDLHDSEAEGRLFAARALGHAVTVFHKRGSGYAGLFTPNRPHKLPKFNTGRAW